MIENTWIGRRRTAIKEFIDGNISLTGTVSGWFEMGARLSAAILVIPILIHFLGNRTAGVWFTFQSTIAMLGCVEFGLRRTFTREISAAFSGENGHQHGDFLHTIGGHGGVMQVYSASRRVFLFVSIAGALLSLSAFYFILARSKMADSITFSEAAAWMVLSLEMAIILLTLPDSALLDGIAKVHVTRFFSGLYAILRGVAIVIGALSTKSLLGASLCSLILSMCYFFALKYSTRSIRHQEEYSAAHKLHPDEFMRLLKLSVPLGFYATGFYLMVSLQPVLIGFLLDPAKVTSFYIPFRLIALMNTGAFQVVVPKFAPFTMAVCSGKKVLALQIFRNAIRLLILLLLLFGSAFILAVPILMNMMDLAPLPTFVIILLVIDSGLLYICAPCADFVVASGKCPFFWSTLVWVGAGVALGIPLTISYGIAGAVMSTMLAGLISRHTHSLIAAFRMVRSLSS